MEKKSIPIITFAVFSVIMLLAYGNIEKAFAITLRSNEPDGTMETPTGFGYNSNFDYLLTTSLQTGDCHLHVVNGDSLTLAADIIVITAGNCGNQGIDSIVCSATLCFVFGQITATNTPTVVRINMITLTVGVTYSELEYNGCTINSIELFGTNIYALISDFGSCPYSGIYQLPTGFVADTANNIQWNEYDSSTSFGNLTGETCLVGGTFFIHVDFNSQRVRKYNLSTKTIASSAVLGALITHSHCDTSESTGFVYATSINGDWTKRVSMDSLTIDGTTISITNPQYVLQRGDSVYVSRDDATTVTSISKANWGTGTFILFSSLAHNDVAFFKGNSTRFNMVAPTTNDNIFYAVDGVIDESEEEEEEGTGLEGSANGVCLNVDANGDGRINVLDCAGSATAFTGFSSGRNATDVTAGITDGLGITNCGTENPDHETCGSGLFMFAFLLLLLEFLALAGYLGFTKLANADRTLMDVGLIMLMLAFVALSIAFYLNWIPDVVFYGIVVMVAGLLTFGLVKHFRGG